MTHGQDRGQPGSQCKDGQGRGRWEQQKRAGSGERKQNVERGEGRGYEEGIGASGVGEQSWGEGGEWGGRGERGGGAVLQKIPLQETLVTRCRCCRTKSDSATAFIAIRNRP